MAEYYRDVLGFTVTAFYGPGPDFVILNRDGVRLLCRTAPEPRPLLSNMTVPGGLTDLYFYVDDVEALAEDIRAKGAEITREPTLVQIYDGKELHVRDCNGRTLCFGQLMS